MKNLLKLWTVWMLAASVCALQAEVVDRIVARVNRQAILLSEVEDELRFEQFSSGSEAVATGLEEALQRLIDRTLIEQQMARTSMPPAAAAEVRTKVAEFRKQILPGAEDAAWQQRLATYNLTEDEVEDRLAQEVRIAHYIDIRFRATVRVSRAEIQDYYDKQLTPRFQQKKQAPPPLPQVSAQIAEILTQQQINDHVNEWLQSLRGQAQIESTLARDAGGRATGTAP